MYCLEVIVAMNKPKPRICQDCSGLGFVESNDPDDNFEIQRCDECKIFDTDLKAKQEWNRYHMSPPHTPVAEETE